MGDSTKYPPTRLPSDRCTTVKNPNDGNELESLAAIHAPATGLPDQSNSSDTARTPSQGIDRAGEGIDFSSSCSILTPL